MYWVLTTEFEKINPYKCRPLVLQAAFFMVKRRKKRWSNPKGDNFSTICSDVTQLSEIYTNFQV